MKKKIDSRIQTLIQNGIKTKQRSILVIVGDRARYQIANFHSLLTKLQSQRSKPKVLWCYKNELHLSGNQTKRMNQIKNMQQKGLYDENVDNSFQLFLSSNQIKYTYYRQSHKVLGNTYQMMILQDFEALTPNLLCRTIETVEGGGIIIILLRTMTSLKQLHTLTMDVHKRYRTQAFSEIQPRFNQRFLLSLSRNKNCVVIDDQLNLLPISDHIHNIVPIEQKNGIAYKAKQQLQSLKKSLENKQIIGKLIATARTLDQAKVIMAIVDALAQKTQASTTAITAGRGRGKSASVGLSVAAALVLGYSCIFVSAPSPDNLGTFFEFVCLGLQMLGYKDRQDYDKQYSNNKQYDKAIMRISVNRNHKQFVQFVFPTDADKIGQADLVVIDEAAAIPLPMVKTFMGNYNLILSSTVNGYEGTGRSLSLKLIQQLRLKRMQGGYRKLRELTMTDPIRYGLDDQVENWLNQLLLLNATQSVPLKGQRLPHPSQCDLYIVNRDLLFSFKASSQKFLFGLMSLFVSSHYKNSPNDLQLLSDSPSHLIFVLLGPLKRTSQGKTQLPDILCAVQLALQGNLSSITLNDNSKMGLKPSGDLIPWNIRQQFQDKEFPQLPGARVVRIATHAKAVKMGYGSRALEQLAAFFQGKLVPLDENVEIQKYNFRGQGVKKPLLKKLQQVEPPKLQYLGTSFGFTQNLLRFWKKNGYKPVYLRQGVNETTCEHSGIMLRPLQNSRHTINVQYYCNDFKRRFISLLGAQFRKLQVSLALQILLRPKQDLIQQQHLMPKQSLQLFVSVQDLNRLTAYGNNQVDYHLVLDLLPTLASLYFSGQFGKHMNLGYANQAVLLGVGLQRKTFDQVCREVKDLQRNNALALFQKTMVKFTGLIKRCYQKQIQQKLPESKSTFNTMAISNDSKRTLQFARQETQKIFEHKGQKQRGKLNYALNDEQIQQQQIPQNGVITLKRKLQDARDYGGLVGKKKVKKAKQ